MKTPRSAAPSRRSFLRSLLAAGAAPLVVPARVLGARSPSNLLHLGFIGVGGHGHNYNLKNFLNQDDCRAVAVCDAFRDRTEKAAATVNEKYGDTACRKLTLQMEGGNIIYGSANAGGTVDTTGAARCWAR